jgi:pimeloyl-ACP methyl ester carboxylesterase
MRYSKHMNYSEWASEYLTKQTLHLHKQPVTVWQASYVKDRPNMLLVHGITGDHYGLVPLVEELSKTYNCLIVELPGHGTTAPVKLFNAGTLQKWFRDIHDVIERDIRPIDVVCAHSFGCTAVVGESNYERRTKTILLNPVPHPSKLYAEYARVIMKFAAFWAAFYNLRAFIFLRSMTLAKVNSWDSRRRISWVSRYSRPSYRQIIYQAGLVDIILDETAYKYVKDRIDLVICGLDDTTASQCDSLELEDVFGTSPIQFLRGGHLLPIESPRRVADLIRRVV